MLKNPSGKAIRVEMVMATMFGNVLGDQDGLIWNCPVDMLLFRAITYGRVLVMGYKTFETMGCKALPGRKCYVMTHKKIENTIENVTFVSSIRELTEKLVDETVAVTVIGGASIYEYFWTSTDKLYRVEIDPAYVKAGIDYEEHKPGLVYVPINIQQDLAYSSASETQVVSFNGVTLSVFDF